jgi:FKBP-type peptidyl-prolyl cis-trans isomerase SlyD
LKKKLYLCKKIQKTMKITPNSVVSVTYKLNTKPEGGTEKFIEEAGKNNPLTFLFGTGGMIAGFESNLNGLSVGDKFNFSVKPEDGYGEKHADNLVELPIEAFKNEKGEVQRDMLKIGSVIPMQDNEGHHMRGVVTKVGISEVTMDFNHPLAGQFLRFEGEVISVRAATAEELSHGHVHGPGGHHH